KSPNIPAWFSEQLPLSFDLALEIARFRGLVDEKIKAKKSPEEIKDFIKSWCYINNNLAGKIYDYLKLQDKFSSIASDRKIVVENYNGEKEYWIFSCLFGRRVNDAFSRAIGFCLARLVGRDVELGINDNGFYIVGEKVDREKIEKAIKFLNEKNVEEILKEAIEKTESLRRRFRHCAARSLMILRNYKGRVKSAGKQQVKSGFLYHAIKKLTGEFPILQEARREVLEDVMDIENTRKIISEINNKRIKIEFIETKIPSPFALNLIMQGHYDLIKMEDRVEFLKRMHKLHMG
ncbi:MAG: ATP-dependent helicase, partial [Candidatus Pacearchaeota archaeon]|nr:ATP-dependent helicase [Candidatus Pacearchaeota archaeon]